MYLSGGIVSIQISERLFSLIRIDYTARYELKNRPAQPSIRSSSKVTLLLSYYYRLVFFQTLCINSMLY